MDDRKAIITVGEHTALTKVLIEGDSGALDLARAALTRIKETFDAYEPGMVKAACEQYEREGEIEVDEGAVCSRSDDPGCYVQAWVWVCDQEA